jgi:protein-tyrosine phosphatase
MNQVLFLCTGNYYRSRFAEHLFNALAIREGLDWRAFSRGLAVERGIYNFGAVSRAAVQGLAARGIDVPASERGPQRVTAADFAAAGHIVALDEAEHRPLVEERFPQWAGAVEYWEIHDLDVTGPWAATAQMERRVQELLSDLREGRPIG